MCTGRSLSIRTLCDQFYVEFPKEYQKIKNTVITVKAAPVSVKIFRWISTFFVTESYKMLERREEVSIYSSGHIRIV